MIRPAPGHEGIEDLRRSRGALILAHSYQPPGIQDLADMVGDSLELSRAARDSSKDVIVVCGVRFMAETAAILAPGRTVIHPVPGSGCPLADCMTVADLEAMKRAHPGASVVTYVNSGAGLKAASWACCTSANAVRVVSAAPPGDVIFGPDRNLGSFVSLHTSRRVHIFDGCCPPHAGADLGHIGEARALWPDAELLVHPETPPAAWDMADAVLGTGGMIGRIGASPSRRFLIGTETGFIHRLQTLFPDRSFMAVGRIACPDMKRITPESVRLALEALGPVVEVDPVTAAGARDAVERMASIG